MGSGARTRFRGVLQTCVSAPRREKKGTLFCLETTRVYPILSISPFFLLAALLLLLELVPLTTSALKQREVPATFSPFYVSVLYTAMLRMSIAAVVLAASISVL